MMIPLTQGCLSRLGEKLLKDFITSRSASFHSGIWGRWGIRKTDIGCTHLGRHDGHAVEVERGRVCCQVLPALYNTQKWAWVSESGRVRWGNVIRFGSASVIRRTDPLSLSC